MMRTAAAVILLGLASLGAQEKKNDAEAEALLQSVQKKLGEAKSIRVEYAIAVKQGGNDQGTVKGAILLKGQTQWKNQMEMASDRHPDQNMQVSLLCDGRKTLSTVPGSKTLFQILKPEESGTILRQSLASGLFTVILYSQPFFAERQEMRLSSKVAQVKDGGRDKVNGKDVRVVEYDLSFEGGFFGRGDPGLKMKSYIDPAAKTVLKREMDLMGTQLTETFTAFAYDEELADSHFSLMNRPRLAKARAEQLARSVELCGRFTGRTPASLDDLLRRPAGLEADAFYPEGGFVAGGALPKDPWGRAFVLRRDGAKVLVVSLGADGREGGTNENEDVAAAAAPAIRQAVGAPTDRLKKTYTSRVQLHLLAAAVKGYLTAYGELPKKKAALWEKPEWATVWPEGGFYPLGKLPNDPWGEPYRMISDEQHVRVQVNDPKARFLTAKQLTAEEKAALEATARPRLSDDEKKEIARAFEDLGQDDLDVREKAEGRLKALGLAAIPTLDERLKVEKDAETKARLAGIRKSIRVPRPSWMDELGTLQLSINAAQAGQVSRGQMASNQRNASASLKTLATAEADFRANDRDGNQIQDFWTGDVAGLYSIYTLGDANKTPQKLIELSVAAADAAPLEKGAAGGLHLGIDDFCARGPKAGYHYRSMTQDNSSTPPESYLQDTGGRGAMGKVHSFAKFGFCAYPAEYPDTGTMTYIINENNTIFMKDTEGEPVLEWPSDDELRAGWSKLD